MALLGRAAHNEGPPRAGQSLQATYTQRYSSFISSRRRAAGLSALWWGPAIAAVSIIAGVSTHFAFFGLLYFVLATAAVLDVLFRKPDSLVKIKSRAAAESETGKALHAAVIRGRATVLHDRVFTATADPFEVEHLVLSPRGAFLIDTKRWGGVRIMGATVYVGHDNQEPLFEAMVKRARALGEALSIAAEHDEEVGIVTVYPVIAVQAEELKGTPRNMRGVTVVTLAQLAPMMRSPDVRWSSTAVDSLAAAAELLLPSKEATGSY